MKIYYVTRWGNEVGGPDEEDTSFIVTASSYLSAAGLVDERLSDRKSSIVSNFCHRITELGEASANREKIIVGPIIENALYHDDIGISDAKKWVRDSVEGGWEKYSDYYEG